MDKAFFAQLLIRALSLWLGGVLSKLGYDAAEQQQFVSTLAYGIVTAALVVGPLIWAKIDRRKAIVKALNTPAPSREIDGGK
jgi:hypothetical protein